MEVTYTKEQLNKATYTRWGHTREGDIHVEGTYTQGDIYTEGQILEGAYAEETCIPRGSGHERPYHLKGHSRREHTYGGKCT